MKDTSAIEQAPSPGRTDLSISMLQANIYAGLFAIPTLLITGALYILRWGPQGAAAGMERLLDSIFPFTITVFVGIVIHELIHGISWVVFGRKPFSVIRFGFQLSTLTPYAHVKEALEVNAYRVGAFMPGLVLGLLPTVLGILIGDGLLTAFGTFFTMAASGDFLILWLIRKVPAGRLVEDHPTRAGCYVLD